MFGKAPRYPAGDPHSAPSPVRTAANDETSGGDAASHTEHTRHAIHAPARRRPASAAAARAPVRPGSAMRVRPGSSSGTRPAGPAWDSELSPHQPPPRRRHKGRRPVTARARLGSEASPQAAPRAADGTQGAGAAPAQDGASGNARQVPRIIVPDPEAWPELAPPSPRRNSMPPSGHVPAARTQRRRPATASHARRQATPQDQSPPRQGASCCAHVVQDSWWCKIHAVNARSCEWLASTPARCLTWGGCDAAWWWHRRPRTGEVVA